MAKKVDSFNVFIFIYSDPPSRITSAIDTPSRILKMDISLNELSSLEHEAFIPLQNLRDLNASLNKITKYVHLYMKHFDSIFFFIFKKIYVCKMDLYHQITIYFPASLNHFLDTLLRAVKKNHLLEKQYFNEVYLFQIHWDRGIKKTLFFESIPQFHISY